DPALGPQRTVPGPRDASRPALDDRHPRSARVGEGRHADHPPGVEGPLRIDAEPSRVPLSLAEGPADARPLARSPRPPARRRVPADPYGRGAEAEARWLPAPLPRRRLPGRQRTGRPHG